MWVVEGWKGFKRTAGDALVRDIREWSVDGSQPSDFFFNTSEFSTLMCYCYQK